MEKLDLKYKKVDERALSPIIDSILANVKANEFISKNQLDYQKIKDNFISFLAFIEDTNSCEGCHSLSECRKKTIGLVSHLELDYYNTISCYSAPCSYLKFLLEMKENYIRQDFADSQLYLKLDPPNDVIPFKERYALSNYLGSMKKGIAESGLYLFGNIGVGKTYLVTCWSNKLALEGKKIAFIDMKKFCDYMRGVVKECGNEVFIDYLDKIKKSDVLIFDNLGNEMISEWSRDSILYDILDYRSRNQLKLNVITSNYSINELKKLYNVDRGVRADRLIELIKANFEQIELLGVNRRR